MADKEKTTSYFNVNGHKKQFRGICLIKELEPDVFLFGAISDSVFVYDMNKETATDLTSLLQNGDKRKRLGSISGALKDDNQFIWIATTKGGLFRLDSNLNLIQIYQKGYQKVISIHFRSIKTEIYGSLPVKNYIS